MWIVDFVGVEVYLEYFWWEDVEDVFDYDVVEGDEVVVDEL